MRVDRKVSVTPEVEIWGSVFGGHEITREVSFAGEGIGILGRLEDPDRFVGPSSYGAVINFGDMCVQEGMRGYMVPESEQWSKDNPPPDGVTILGFENEKVQSWVDEISGIASTDFYSDEEKCRRYYELNKEVFRAIAQHSGVNLQDVKFLGLIRAGAVAGEMLGIPLSEQALIQTKRLHIKGERGGDISIGVTHHDLGKIGELDGKVWLIADPAGATLSSIEAVLIDCLQRGAKPSKVIIWNTVISHQGARFAIDAIRSLGIDVEIVAGGYAPGMNGNYYLETPKGTPSVGDAGDGLNNLLPAGLRLSGVVQGNGFRANL